MNYVDLFDVKSLKIFSQLGFEHQLELPPNITDFLTRFCINLNFSFQQKKEIFKIFKSIKLPPNLKPETICGLVILHYHNIHKTNWNKKEIAKRCEITYQTLLKNYCKFKNLFS